MKSWLALFLLLTLLVPGALFAEEKSEIVIVSLPASNWVLEIDAPGFTILKKDAPTSGTSVRLSAENQAKGLKFTVLLKPSTKKGSATDFREHAWSESKHSPWANLEVKRYEYGRLSVVEHIFPKYGEMKGARKHLNIYLAEGDAWGHVELMKTGYVPEDDGMLQKFLAGIRVKRLEKAAPK